MRPAFFWAPEVSVFCLEPALPRYRCIYWMERRPTAFAGTTCWLLGFPLLSLQVINLELAALVEAIPPIWIAPAKKLSRLPMWAMRLLAGAAAVFSLSVILSWILLYVSER